MTQNQEYTHARARMGAAMTDPEAEKWKLRAEIADLEARNAELALCLHRTAHELEMQLAMRFGLDSLGAVEKHPIVLAARKLIRKE